MKTRSALIIGFALTAAVAAQAQNIAQLSTTEVSHSRDNSPKILNFQKVEANYLLTLNSDVSAVVESALGHVTLMRIKYPEQDLKKIQEKLYDLASQGTTKSIRQKAFTAMQVFANPSAFNKAIESGQTCGDGLLENLASQL